MPPVLTAATWDWKAGTRKPQNNGVNNPLIFKRYEANGLSLLTRPHFMPSSSQRSMPKKTSERKKLSRNERRDLDIEIGFMEGVIRRDPSFVKALQILGDDYTRRGKVAEGLRVDKQLAELCPEDSLVHYNLACSYTLTAQYDDAFSALDRALNLGYRDFRWLAKDPDLDTLRKHPLYKKIRAKVRSLKVKTR
jgi:tetratricopeptide (TPR) repeat protein